MNLSRRQSISLCMPLVLLYLMSGLYALHERDALFTSDIELNGRNYRVEKLRGFIEKTSQGFTLDSGGYQYVMLNPSTLDARTARFGDSAVYYYDNGLDYVAVHIEHNDFIFLKYLFSLGALLFVIYRLVEDHRLSRSAEHG